MNNLLHHPTPVQTVLRRAHEATGIHPLRLRGAWAIACPNDSGRTVPVIVKPRADGGVAFEPLEPLTDTELLEALDLPEVPVVPAAVRAMRGRIRRRGRRK